MNRNNEGPIMSFKIFCRSAIGLYYIVGGANIAMITMASAPRNWRLVKFGFQTHSYLVGLCMFVALGVLSAIHLPSKIQVNKF